MEPFDTTFPTAPPTYPPPLPAPAPTSPPARTGALRRATTVLLALQLPFAAGALLVAGPGDDVTPDLALAADRTEAVEHLRMDVLLSMEIDGDGFDDVLLVQVEQAGDRVRAVTDAGAMDEAMGGGGGADGRVEMLAVDGRVYLHAPLFAALGDEQLPPLMRPLAELGDRWGTYALADVGDAAAVAEAVGITGTGLEGLIDLVRAADGEVEELGADEVHGVAVEELGATIDFEDLLDTPGFGEGFVAGFVGSGPSGIDPDVLLDALRDLDVPLTVSVADDGLVRRATFRLDRGFLEAIAEALGEPAPPRSLDFEMEMVLELYDLDDPSIVVEPPDVEDPVDLTAWAIEVAEAAAG